MADSWQLRLTNLFNAFTPEQIQRREPYWHEDDMGVHNVDQNMVLRLRDYSSDGHGYRQESVLATGANVGTLQRGNDRVGDVSSHLTYADVIVNTAKTFNLKVSSLLWNSVPFNPLLNPTNSMPPGLASAEDAFQFAKASIPGMSSIDEMNSISSLWGKAGLTGDANFTTPFETYCSLTPQKIPLMNFGMIMLLQAISRNLPLYLTTFPGAPVAPSPLLLSILPLIKMQTTTGYTASIQGTIIGKQLKSFLLSSVSGMNLAF